MTWQIKLSKDAEEVAGYYAVCLETEHAQNSVFNANFFKDWRKKMTDEERAKITQFSLCDFSLIHQYLMANREKLKELNKEPETKKKNKEERDRLVETYGTAIVDGFCEKVGNFKVEPPSLFRVGILAAVFFFFFFFHFITTMSHVHDASYLLAYAWLLHLAVEYFPQGRGEHPKTGYLKQRVKPEDIVLNIGKGVPIPPAPEGHKWKGIVHNNKVRLLFLCSHSNKLTT